MQNLKDKLKPRLPDFQTAKILKTLSVIRKEMNEIQKKISEIYMTFLVTADWCRIFIEQGTLREKCLKTELFLVRVFLSLD